MKQIKKSILLPLVAIGGGAIGLLLRFWLLRSAVDSEGLLIHGHPSVWLLNLFCAAVIVALFFLTGKPGGPGKYYANFPDFAPGGICAFAAAAGLFFSILGELIGRPDLLTGLCDMIGLLAVFSLAFTGYCRLNHRRPGFLFHALICIFLILRLICRYRSWSSDPQLQDYACELLATICLMLGAYHRAAFDLNMGSRRALQFWGLAGTFFAIVSLAGSEPKLLYGTLGLWMVTNLCRLDPLPEDPKEEPQPEAPAPETNE